MTTADIAAAKAALRAELLDARRALDAETVRVLSLSIEERIARLDQFRNARTVHLYIAARDGEVETRGLVLRALHAGKRVLCPRAERGPTRLDHYEIASLDDLEESRFQLWEPAPDRARRADASDADLVIVPGLAFDRGGWRIGFGAGYYDRFLAESHAPTIAPAYSLQLRDRIPREPHDVPVDLIATELETIDGRAERERP